MVAQAMVYTLNSRNADIEQLFERYRSLIRAKTDDHLTGRLSAAGFMLLLAEMAGQRTLDWRRLSNVYAQRIKDRGGPEQVLQARNLTVERPRIISLHLEYLAVLEVFGA